MKPIKTYITILLLITWAFIANVNAQEKSNWKGHTFQFKAKPLAKGDSLHKFYCMMRKADLQDYTSITVKYNNKSKKFLTKDIQNSKSADYTINRDFVLFDIDEKLLDAPYVTIEGEDAQGKKYNVCERNAKGEIIDPCEKEKWKKAVARVDSMDFVRKFDNVFIDKDGKPCYKDKDGKIYIIEKSSTKRVN